MVNPFRSYASQHGNPVQSGVPGSGHPKGEEEVPPINPEAVKHTRTDGVKTGTEDEHEQEQRER